LENILAPQPKKYLTKILRNTGLNYSEERGWCQMERDGGSKKLYLICTSFWRGEDTRG
jgi:hypothetical protein